MVGGRERERGREREGERERGREGELLFLSQASATTDSYSRTSLYQLLNNPESFLNWTKIREQVHFQQKRISNYCTLIYTHILMNPDNGRNTSVQRPSPSPSQAHVRF